MPRGNETARPTPLASSDTPDDVSSAAHEPPDPATAPFEFVRWRDEVSPQLWAAPNERLVLCRMLHETTVDGPDGRPGSDIPPIGTVVPLPPSIARRYLNNTSEDGRRHPLPWAVPILDDAGHIVLVDPPGPPSVRVRLKDGTSYPLVRGGTTFGGAGEVVEMTENDARRFVANGWAVRVP